MSLRRQFVLVLATFSVVLATIFGALTWRIARDALERELDRRLVQIPLALVMAGSFQARSVMSYGTDIDAEPYRNRLDSLLNFVDEAFIFDASVYDRTSGEAVFSPTNYVSADRAVSLGDTLYFLAQYEESVMEAVSRGTSTTDAFEGTDGRTYKYGFVRLDPEESAVLGVQIPADYLRPLASLSRSLFFATLAALAVAVLLSGVLARNIATPLERLSRVAIRIQRGHMDQEVIVERGDEVGRLSRAMERMRQGILERDEQLRLMLAQVAHEIRNPLGGLELFAAAAAETDDKEERIRLMSRVRGEVTALNEIIDDFLTFARPQPPESHATDLREAVRSAAELCRGEVTDIGLELTVELPERPLLAVADEDQVKRAVLNLLRNAIQAAESRVEVGAGEHGSEIEIRVADDGPGVKPELGSKIFEPFFTEKEKGAGLGLAIVRKFVESYGGRVEVGDGPAPSVGRGAEFRIYFPGLEEPPPEPRADDPGD